MNHRYALLLILLLNSSSLSAQTITLSAPIPFDTVLVNTTDSLSFWVRNAGATPFSVTDINTTRPEFRAKDTSFAVPANDSVRVYVYFMTNQNMTWKDVLLVFGTGLQGALPLGVSGTARYTDPLYNPTQGLWENALKTALTNIVANHTSLGYNIARDRMFETIDDLNLTDTIECVYIGRRIRAVTRTEAQNQNFNTEHTWPQSFFADEPMVSDLNHLYPTDAVPNSNRANFPFGPVVSNITYNVGGSKLGQRADGAMAFEPRDVHKGDVARALFYFTIRYGNLGGYMDATQENDLRVWYKFDPVSTKEIQRNNRIATYQIKRNPLIDHPEFFDRISSFHNPAAPTLFPDISTSASTINFGSIAAGDSVEWTLVILNNGRASLGITGLTLQTPSSSFRIVDTPTTVPVDSFRQVRLRFVPTQANQSYSNSLVVQSNDPDEGTVNIALAGSSGSSSALTVTIQLNAGWNMISLPVIPANPAVTSVFPTAVSPAFVYSSGYAQRDTLIPGLGYWLKFSSSQSVSISGVPTPIDTIDVNAGWNLLGSVSYPVSSASVASLPPGIIVSSFFEFSGGYVPTVSLSPMGGYWVRCSQPGQIILQGSVARHFPEIIKFQE